MWWVGFETVTWTGEGGQPTWYETFEGHAKRGFLSGEAIGKAPRIR